MPTLAGVNLVLLAAALMGVYVLGYVAGAWLVPPATTRPALALGMVRLVAGWFLSATSFMLGMAVGLPWWVGPLAVVGGALGKYRWRALAFPQRPTIGGWKHLVGYVIGLVLLAPMLIASLRMAPGDYPPMFFSVDTPYFLEKVHALTKSSELPPLSLGMLGGKYVYHYGSHAAAALISRVTLLPPHQTLFLVLTPALLLGIFAAAVVTVEAIGPRVPSAIALPLLLVPTPALWYPFWHALVPRLEATLVDGSLRPLAPLLAEYEMWGVANINGQNLASEFIVLGAIGGLAASRSRGWRLPVFLIGSAILFKAQSAIALLGGLAAMQSWEALRERRLQPLVPLAAAAALFGVVYSALWMLPQLPVSFRTELHPFAHLDYLRDRDWIRGFVADLAWLLAPGLLLWRGARSPADRSRIGLLLFALAPLFIVNTTRGLDLRPGKGYDEDWFQIIIVTPMLIHAVVLMIAEWGWGTASRIRRYGFVALTFAAIVPPMIVAAAYSRVLIEHPAAGHEYVNNHALGEALRAVPVPASVLVTNDLRYPAEEFRRTNRQMQIPALFGHQAFAINYAYEVYDFSEERMQLQRLLESDVWSPAIDAAARRYGWTHLIVRKDFPHPQDIPLTKVYDGPEYSVFQFSPAA
jgi:hypothetical protein